MAGNFINPQEPVTDTCLTLYANRIIEDYRSLRDDTFNSMLVAFFSDPGDIDSTYYDLQEMKKEKKMLKIYQKKIQELHVRLTDHSGMLHEVLKHKKHLFAPSIPEMHKFEDILTKGISEGEFIFTDPTLLGGQALDVNRNRLPYKPNFNITIIDAISSHQIPRVRVSEYNMKGTSLKMVCENLRALSREMRYLFQASTKIRIEKLKQQSGLLLNALVQQCRSILSTLKEKYELTLSLRQTPAALRQSPQALENNHNLLPPSQSARMVRIGKRRAPYSNESNRSYDEYCAIQDRQAIYDYPDISYRSSVKSAKRRR